MSFKLTSATATQLVFESPKERSARGAWLFTGGLITTAVVVNRLFPGFDYPALVILQGLFLMVGWFLLMILVYSPEGPHLSAPSRITFDRARGFMKIEPDPGGKGDPVIISFSKVAKADLDVQTKTDKDNRVITTYHLYIQLTSGGCWYLCSTQNGEEADGWIKQLGTVIDRSVVSEMASKIVLPQRWKMESSVDQMLVSWTNPLGNRPWRLLRQTIVFAAHLGGIMYFIGSRKMAGELLIVLAMLSPLLAFIGWLAFRALKRLLRDWVTQFAVRLSKDGFDYYEFAKKGGALRNHVHLELNEIETFRHTHAPALVLPHDIEVVRKDSKEPVTLFSDLTPIERQRGVDWLQYQVTQLRANQV